MTVSYLDISMTIEPGMVVWAGDKPVVLESTQSTASGGPYNLSYIMMSLHAGTHIDAPLHFIEGGLSVAEMPLDTMIGPARVVEISDAESIKREELKGLGIGQGERLLLKTANSKELWPVSRFSEDFVYISADAAAYLAGLQLKCVGIDYLSVGGFEADAEETHKTLLQAGIWVIEGLDLSRVTPGDYELICLPLKVERGDGAPARAILKPLPS
jgi:arylformamidase